MGSTCSVSKNAQHSEEEDPDSLPYRIKCSKVSLKLDFQGENFTSIPTEVCDATHLQKLILSSNQIREIPPKFSQLTNLQDLQFFDNCLLQISSETAKLSALQILNLSNNLISQLPADFGNLSQLTELLLWGNKIQSLPDSTSSFVNLSLLDVSFNNIQSLPRGIGGLSKLMELKASGNSISCLPESFGQLRAMQMCDLSNNCIDMLPASVSSLSKLLKVNLKQNRLSSIADGFGCMSLLSELNLQSNVLSFIPDSLTRASSLKRLILTDNKITGLPHTIGSLTALNMLLIDQNPVKEIPEELFSIPSLSSVQFSEHEATTVPITMANSKSLFIFFMVNGQLEHLPANFPVIMDRLSKVDLSHNKLRAFPDSCSGLEKIQDLKLFKNKLERLPASISQLTNLQYLNVHSNRISVLPDIFSSFTKLKKLLCSFNRISGIPQSISSLTSLVEFHASHNPISNIPEGFSNLKNLKGLWLAACDLTREDDIRCIGHLSNLSNLDLAKNRLSRLPDEVFVNCGKLVRLDVSDTDLEDIVMEPNHLQRFKSLDVYGTPFISNQSKITNPHIQNLNELSLNLLHDAASIPLPLGIQVGLCTYIGRRMEMEDHICLLSDPSERYYLLGIFDGHEGTAACTLLRDTFPRIFSSFAKEKPLLDSLRLTYAEMDKLMKETTLDRSGSTSLTVVISESQIIVGNVGDSRAVLSRSNVASRISIDHKPHNPDEHSRIRASGGFVTEDGRVSGMLAVSRSFGDLHLQPFVTPEPYLQSIPR
eukprot:TRINITY_DN816_c0_g2_i3.p1 TRINITY_DN816_c0_g2~~TRINITY_DN816_c0_g2_i3.p1  ORF type:complete len:767 (-),score=132.73 TRINITY_DN816_c0_g2_i3:48-2348(-)